ncbi:hypothetical protein F2P56_025626 [Juglans regia]|uniref:Uncharacterized protein LOC108983173 n=2 Tax=Juglans regia TaxID=51240 RepID=A0A2I4DT03_JUGRE|nr:uncharacterized protein LOC108983173 [Juglans regia]KAF5456115.1 hypothetical protein F2P56_025626 [Juglans regia]
MAAYHMHGEALIWYKGAWDNGQFTSWETLTRILQIRFGPTTYDDPMEALTKLKQTSTVSAYQTQFEALSNRINGLSDAHKLSCFISGLKDDVRLILKMFNPTSLIGAFGLKIKIYLLQGCEALEEDQLESGYKGGQLEEDSVLATKVEGNPEISLNAIAGTPSPGMMRVKGTVSGEPIVILVDSGSSHSFLHLVIARRANLDINQSTKLAVRVANGSIIQSEGHCDSVPLKMQGTQLCPSLYILELGGCDIVLGVNWLATLGLIVWDFSKLSMQLKNGGHKVELRGLEPTPISLEGSSKVMLASMTKGIGFLQQIQIESKVDSVVVQNTEVSELLTQFQGVFEEPNGLPPVRDHDHKIVLKEGTPPISNRPYRYPYYQKTEIEKIVAELLKTGVIRPNSSHFSSPILLVRKVYGSWRTCVDYRPLNQHTIKDKFLIPVIDELLDELGGARVFSKLDLRSGNHQIRVVPEDIEKTIFRTHEGHYEFLVMPFGLTNAPSTFQGLMNQVFKQFLRRFVLVFFDDILVYNRRWKEHLQHLKQVLEVLQQHQLYAKMSKCRFGVEEVDYLGHIISFEGVRACPNKIKSMLDWPSPKNTKALRGFLGLTGYYRKFIKGYGVLAAPLTSLLKKNNFGWTSDAE